MFDGSGGARGTTSAAYASGIAVPVFIVMNMKVGILCPFRFWVSKDVNIFGVVDEENHQ
jgi:hypothetical protein